MSGMLKYGVQFDADGPVYRPDQVEVGAAGKCIADLRSKLAAAEAECAASMDEIARERARAEAAEAREMQLRHALEQFDALYDMLDVEDAILGDSEYFYGSAKVGGITYGDVRRSHAALSASPSDYRERVRREEATGLCAAGFDIPLSGPCPHCGATDDDLCRRDPAGDSNANG